MPARLRELRGVSFGGQVYCFGVWAGRRTPESLRGEEGELETATLDDYVPGGFGEGFVHFLKV